MKTYYERRAAEYDATSYELALEEPQSAQDLLALKRVAAAATHGRVLDIGCGTGWLTRFVRGEIVGVDQSEAMLRIAASRIPNGRFIQASIPPLPFCDGSFDVIFSSHLYGHLEIERDRQAFVAEALRVAPELVVVEQAWRPGLPRAGWEDRTISDGSHHTVYKRYFTADDLAAEIGGRVLLDTATFVAAAADRPRLAA